MGLSLALFAKTRAKKYSFQNLMKLKIVIVTRAGCARGNIILQKHPTGEQPSMVAASTKVFEMPLKKVIRKNVV